MATCYVELDVHSKQSTFVIEDAEGKVIAQGEVPKRRPAFERLCWAQADRRPFAMLAVPRDCLPSILNSACQALSSSRKDLASLRSAVSKPSVNQP